MLSMPRIVRPDPHRFRGRNLGPPLDRLLADPIKRNKELLKFLPGWGAVNQNREVLLDVVQDPPAQRLARPK